MSTEPDITAQKIHFGDDIKPVRSAGYSINRRISLSEKDDLEADQKKFADEDRNHKKKQASPFPSTKTSVTRKFTFDATRTLLVAHFLITQSKSVMISQLMMI